MPRRIQLKLDQIVHYNNVTFEVYRGTNGVADDTSTHVMSISDPLTVKTEFTETSELLTRDPSTPYAFLVKRHYEESPFPQIFIGTMEVNSRDVALFPEDKSIEVHNGDLGLADGKNAYLTYNYLAFLVKDDPGSQNLSGVTYYGPPATGINEPSNLVIVQDFAAGSIKITFDEDYTPIQYTYHIKAIDSDGNFCWSDLVNIGLTPDPTEVYFHIQRSKDGVTWEEAAPLMNQHEWHLDLAAADLPKNVQNLVVTPVDSHDTTLEFDNPWYNWPAINRQSYQYRIRAEDTQGEATDWVNLNPFSVYLKPQELLIRRAEDNGAPASETGLDAIDVFRLHAADVDATQPRLKLTDDQLSEALKYGYTIFLTDETGQKAEPLFAVSDNAAWANVILLSSQTKTDSVKTQDIETTFELADQLIDIGGVVQ